MIFDEFHNALRGRARDVEAVLAFLRRIGRQFDISPVLIGEVAVYDFINQTAEMATRLDLMARSSSRCSTASKLPCHSLVFLTSRMNRWRG